jgi:hypothetical protein
LLLEHPWLQVMATSNVMPLRPCLEALDAGHQSAAGRVLDAATQARLIAHRKQQLPLLSARFMDIPAHAIQDEPSFARLLDQQIRPGGLVVCDIQLPTLPYAPVRPGKVYGGARAASLACRLQGERQEPCAQEAAVLLVVSQRSKFGPRPDKTLVESGVHVGRDNIYRKPDDLLELARHIRDAMRMHFPWQLQMQHPHDRRMMACYVGLQDKALIDRNFDLAFWPIQDGMYPVSGRAVLDGKGIVKSSGRAQVLMTMIHNHLHSKERETSSNSIEKILAKLAEQQTVSQVIDGIRRLLYVQDQRRLIPKSANSAYRFSDDARVALILEPSDRRVSTGLVSSG